MREEIVGGRWGGEQTSAGGSGKLYSVAGGTGGKKKKGGKACGGLNWGLGQTAEKGLKKKVKSSFMAPDTCVGGGKWEGGGRQMLSEGV